MFGKAGSGQHAINRLFSIRNEPNLRLLVVDMVACCLWLSDCKEIIAIEKNSVNDTVAHPDIFLSLKSIGIQIC